MAPSLVGCPDVYQNWRETWLVQPLILCGTYVWCYSCMSQWHYSLKCHDLMSCQRTNERKVQLLPCWCISAGMPLLAILECTIKLNQAITASSMLCSVLLNVDTTRCSFTSCVVLSSWQRNLWRSVGVMEQLLCISYLWEARKNTTGDGK